MKEARTRLYRALLDKNKWIEGEDFWYHPHGVRARIKQDQTTQIEIYDGVGYPLHIDDDTLIQDAPILEFDLLARIHLQHPDGNIPELLDCCIGPSAWTMLKTLLAHVAVAFPGANKWKINSVKSEYVLKNSISHPVPKTHNLNAFLEGIRVFDRPQSIEMPAIKQLTIPNVEPTQHQRIELLSWCQRAMNVGLTKDIMNHPILKMQHPKS